jgi:hypothetical protein
MHDAIRLGRHQSKQVALDAIVVLLQNHHQHTLIVGQSTTVTP